MPVNRQLHNLPNFDRDRGDPFHYGRKKYKPEEKISIAKARTKGNYKYGTEAVVGAGAAVGQHAPADISRAVTEILDESELKSLSLERIIEKYDNSEFTSVNKAKDFVKLVLHVPIQHNMYVGRGGIYELKLPGVRFVIKTIGKRLVRLSIIKTKR